MYYNDLSFILENLKLNLKSDLFNKNYFILKSRLGITFDLRFSIVRTHTHRFATRLNCRTSQKYLRKGTQKIHDSKNPLRINKIQNNFNEKKNVLEHIQVNFWLFF